MPEPYDTLVEGIIDTFDKLLLNKSVGYFGFEGLNNAAMPGSNMIVLFNDNEMYCIQENCCKTVTYFYKNMEFMRFYKIQTTNLLLLIMREKWYTEHRVFLFGFLMKQSEKEQVIMDVCYNKMALMNVIVRIFRTLDCMVNEILDIIPRPDNGTADNVQS